MGLCRETNLDGHVLIKRELIEEHILNVDGLAGTGRAYEEGRDKLFDAVFLNVTVSDLIYGSNNDVLDLRILRELVNFIPVGKVEP